MFAYQSDREKITLSLLFNEKLVNLLIKDWFWRKILRRIRIKQGEMKRKQP
jgi:hypothetical protein